MTWAYGCPDGDIDCYTIAWANAEKENEYLKSKNAAQSRELAIAYKRVQEERKRADKIEAEPSFRAPLYFIAGLLVGGATAIIWKEAKDK